MTTINGSLGQVEAAFQLPATDATPACFQQTWESLPQLIPDHITEVIIVVSNTTSVYGNFDYDQHNILYVMETAATAWPATDHPITFSIIAEPA